MTDTSDKVGADLEELIKNRVKSCATCAIALKGSCPTQGKKCADWKAPGASCDRCLLYLLCPNPNKAETYVCTEYKRDSSKKYNNAPKPKPEELVDEKDFDNEEEFDLQKLVQSATQSDALVPPDLRVPDGDFPKAKNFVEFCLSQTFLNVVPFAKQLESGIKLFSEWCPDCNDDYIHNIPYDAPAEEVRSKVIIFEDNVCPLCKKPRHAFIKEGKLKAYNELAGLAGQRGGKSAFIAMADAYHTHLLLKSQNPQRMYNLLPNSVLHGTVIALTFAQAKASLWDPIYGYLTETPWFIAYNKMLQEVGLREGVELVKLKDTFVHYRHRSLVLSPSGPNMKTLRGYTRCKAAIDEIGWFDSVKSSIVKANANEVHHAVGRSLLTVRSACRNRLAEGYDVPNGIMYNVSSPSNARDKIVSLYKQSQKPSSRVYGFWYTTFELNPTISQEDLQEEFDADPIAARRDYLAIPPQATSPFIFSLDVLRVNVRKQHNPAKLTRRVYRSKSGAETCYGTVDFTGCDTAVPKILAIDAGYCDNSFAITIASLEGGETRVEAFIEIIPLPEQPLNHSLIVEEIIYAAIEKLNIVMVAADRWQSIKFLQDIDVKFSIATLTYSVKYNDFLDFRTKLNDGKCSIPLIEMKRKDIESYTLERYPSFFDGDPVSHFAFQCITVVDLKKTVDKGDGTTDDLFRATVLAHTILHDPENWALFDSMGMTRTATTGRTGVLGVSSRISSSSANIGGSSSRAVCAVGSLGGRRR